MLHLRLLQRARTWGWVLVLACSPALAHAQAAAPEYALKAALLLKLPRFVYVPGLADDAPATLCVLGDNPFGATLQDLARQPIDGRQILVRPLRAGAPADGCNFVFIARSQQAELAQTLQALAGAAVVTVSDLGGFARAGGMVELARDARDDARLRIALNPQAARAQGVGFNAQLLRLATVVEP